VVTFTFTVAWWYSWIRNRTQLDETWDRMWYYAASSGNPLPTFRDNVSAPSSRLIDPCRWDGQVVPKHCCRITTLRCVTSHKSVHLISVALEAWNHGRTLADEATFSSVSTGNRAEETVCTTRESVFDYREGQTFFSSPQHPKRIWVVIRRLCKWYRGAFLGR
jgi:hypothetical protein